MTIPEIPAGTMEYAERVSESIVKANRNLFNLFFHQEHNVVVIATRPNEDGTNSYIVMSNYDDKQEMVAVMHEAARKSVDGSMIDGADFKEPKH